MASHHHQQPYRRSRSFHFGARHHRPPTTSDERNDSDSDAATLLTSPAYSTPLAYTTIHPINNPETFTTSNNIFDNETAIVRHSAPDPDSPPPPYSELPHYAEIHPAPTRGQGIRLLQEAIDAYNDSLAAESAPTTTSIYASPYLSSTCPSTPPLFPRSDRLLWAELHPRLHSPSATFLNPPPHRLLHCLPTHNSWL